MCGIAGFIDMRLAGKSDALKAQALAMSDAIRHRGPDGDGVFVEPEAGLALSHRRLAIVDLSAAGAQPMASASGRFVICYNGEVYNAEDMRRDPALDGVAWRGHSDTEVILEYAAVHGLERMLREANGMFALALWDRKERKLSLARDRMGIKPLFVARAATGLAFASELKAIRQVDGLADEIDPGAVANYLRFAYVPSPNCIYRGVHKVLPGTWEEIGLRSAWQGREPEAHCYWSLRDVAQRGVAQPLALDDQTATDALQTLLADAVRRQLVSDVPLGALLSGGVDSSAVAAMMAASASQTVRTFSIGFENAEFDESEYAAAVARHLGTAHTELRVTAQDALNVIPLLPVIYDEPFADSSQIPTYLVSKLTRQHVTVALSGDGGDELFAGYNRHKFAAGLGLKLRRVPYAARKFAGAVLGATPARGVAFAASLLPQHLRAAQAADKMQKLARVLSLDDAAIYLSLVSQIENLEEIAPALAAHVLPVAARSGPVFPRSLEDMQYRDMASYLPDDILQKVDRASMAVALEVRPPFLDHRLVEFAWKLPTSMKIRRGETKWLLRRMLERNVPKALISRPKMGFAIPLAEWLQGPLADWASDTLRTNGRWSEHVSRDGVWRLWERHRSGRENLAYALWPVLMLAAWDTAGRARSSTAVR